MLAAPYWRIQGPHQEELLLEQFRIFDSRYFLSIVSAPEPPIYDALQIACDQCFTAEDLISNGEEGSHFVFRLGRHYSPSLNQIIEEHAAPEYCSHVKISASSQLVFTWYDFPDGDLEIVDSLPTEVRHMIQISTGRDCKFIASD